MEKYFCDYNQSLTLKEFGFDEPCFGRYKIGGDFVLSHTERYVISNGTDRTKYFILRPLKSQVFEWFREKYNLHHEITFNGSEYLAYVSGLTDNIFKTYEEAESACIDKLIEIVQNNLDN